MSKTHVVIVGGSSGIGLATAGRLRDDHQVTIIGRDPERLAAAGRRVPEARTLSADAADPASIAGAFSAIGGFDHLVLALSGGRGAGAFRQLAIDDLRAGLESKLLPHLSVAQAALPTLRTDGSLTFVSAASGRTARPGTAGLAAINAGIEAAARVLAVELAPLRVNVVSPGVVDTPWWEGVPAQFKETAFAQASAVLPSRRVGRPEEVGALITLIMKTGYIAGAVYDIDGGQRLVAM